MNTETMDFCRTVVFAYLVGEFEMDPIQARQKVDSMTDEEIGKFLK